MRARWRYIARTLLIYTRAIQSMRAILFNAPSLSFVGSAQFACSSFDLLRETNKNKLLALASLSSKRSSELTKYVTCPYPAATLWESDLLSQEASADRCCCCSSCWKPNFGRRALQGGARTVYKERLHLCCVTQSHRYGNLIVRQNTAKNLRELTRH